MDLWIRSQDRIKLVQVNKIVVSGTYNNEIFANDEIKLGRYENKDRALEVLDDIQRILHPIIEIKSKTNYINNKNISESFEKNLPLFVTNGTSIVHPLQTYVYEMPNE